MPASPPPPRPLDRALDHLLRKAPERALADLLGIIEARRDPAALWAAGRALAECAAAGRPTEAAAEKVLRAAARTATRARNLALAAAACAALEELGCSAATEYDEIGTTFAGPWDDAPPPNPPDPNAVLPPPPDLPSPDLEFLDLVDRIEAVSEQVAEGEVAVGSPGTTELLCSKLGPQEVGAFARTLEPRLAAAGDVLIEEGRPGRAAYFIARGEVQVVRAGRDGDDQVLARLGAGSLFGEMALLSRSPRAASVLALRPCIVLRGSRRALDAVAAANPRLGRALASFCRRRMIDNLVRTSAVLRPLRTAEREALLGRFRARSFEAGQVVIAAGEEQAGLHLLASGTLRVLAEEAGETTQLATLSPGEVVGEVGLVLRRPAPTSVVAECPAVTLHLPAEEFLSVIKEHPELLAQLYELAVQREDETRNLLAQPAQDASDWVLI